MVPTLPRDVRRRRHGRSRPLTLARDRPASSSPPHTLPTFPAQGDPPRPWWRLREPSTTLTDLAITVAAALFAWPLLQSSAVAAHWLAAGMLATAAAALGGAAVHGVPHKLGERGWRLTWRLTLQAALVANAALLVSVGTHALGGAARLAWLLAAAAKLVLFAIAAWRRYEFRLVVLDSAVTLVAVGVLQLAMLSVRDPSAPLILAAVGASVVAGIVQRSGLSLHRHFNHNDLYHVVQLVALYLFYRGGLLFAPA